MLFLEYDLCVQSLNLLFLLSLTVFAIKFLACTTFIYIF
ncbi:hypothetical protein CSUNSWCD_1779 [Campylobacter showae CSUNSWCD]|uniref:Uncharacterized protein n=1 Tax=Campylobacter showae CSUNSWCD TaxID=1244083 RepID=M5IRD9_9BACT|nr:hypothetical protein CSUNSWCD_1779 [Campylobacter showae CSUNSWCD]